jgi:hypothetical protein
MIVKLGHAKNPDIHGGYWVKPKDGKRSVDVDSFAMASGACLGYIKRNGLGAGNWSGGQVYDGEKQVAIVSYNGRVWGMDGKEITW